MKFIRRHDLTPHTRIEMVRLAWLHQGIYGKMTQIAQEYHISRTFLYQLMWAANLQLETLFSDHKPHLQAPQPLLEPFILLLRLEGKCSIPSMSSILKYFQYQPNSVGYLSECFQNYGAALPSTLSMVKHTVVFYLSDEMFARHQPILVTIEAQSTAILKIQLASDRSAETWKAHFDDLGDHRFHRLGMASDRGRGLVAGYQAACQDAAGCVIGFMSFETSLTGAANWSAKPMRPLPRRTKPRKHSTTPKARPICTSGSNTMNTPTTRVSKPSHDTISSISCSICSATPCTCVPPSVGSVRSQASAQS